MAYLPACRPRPEPNASSFRSPPMWNDAARTGVRTEPAAPRRTSYAELTHRLVLDEFAPAAVLINRKHEILYFLRFDGPLPRHADRRADSGSAC